MGIFSSAFAVKHSSSEKISSNWIPSHIMQGANVGVASKSGIVVSEETARHNSAVFACQRAISESIAMLPRDILKKGKRGGREVVENHPTSRALKRLANPLQTAFQFFNNAQRHALSSGNGYAEQQFDSRGNVIAFWPIPPHRVTPRYVLGGNEPDIVYDVTLPDGNKVTLTKDRMLHIPGIGFDGLKGYPLVEFMAQAVGLGQAIEEYGSLFFKQGAGQGGYVSVPDSFSEEQINNLQSHYGVLNEGMQTAHRFKFLYESSKFQPTSITPSDSQMIDTRIFQIQEVARFHRMVLHKIQETSKATGYNSLEQFNIEFVNDTLMPWIVNFEQELDRKLFDEGEDYYVKFNVNALLRGDAKSRALYYRTMVFTSIMTVNEARALEDLPPIEGGDERLIPLNMSVGGEDPEDDSGDDTNTQGKVDGNGD